MNISLIHQAIPWNYIISSEEEQKVFCLITSNKYNLEWHACVIETNSCGKVINVEKL